jgi:succinoglycan biosynthesis transport protein ExoP
MSEPNADSRRVDLGLAVDALRHRWRVMAVAMLIVPLVSVAAWAIIKPKVKMSALIAVQDSMKLNPVFKDMAVEWSMRNELPLVTSILTSRTTLERVLKDLGTVTAASTHDEVDGLVRDFQGRLEVYPEGGNLIRMSFIDRDPERSYRAVVRLTDALVEEMVRPQREALDQSVGFLKEQRDRIEGEIKEIEAKLKLFKANGAGDAEMRKINLEARSRLQTSIDDTESSFVAAEQRVRLAKQRLLRYDPESKTLRAELDDAEERVERLQKTFTDKNPQVRAAMAEAARLQRAIDDRSQRRIAVDIDDLEESAPPPEARVQARADGQAADIIIRADDVMSSDLLTYQAASAEVESLRFKLDLLKKKEQTSADSTKDFADSEQEFNRLARNLEAKSKVFTSLSEKYEDALVSRELNRQEETKMVRIVERPTGPVQPRRIPISLVLFATPIIGLIIGAFFALALEVIDPTVRDPSEVEELAGAPVIGTLPWIAPSRR